MLDCWRGRKAPKGSLSFRFAFFESCPGSGSPPQKKNKSKNRGATFIALERRLLSLSTPLQVGILTLNFSSEGPSSEAEAFRKPNDSFSFGMARFRILPLKTGRTPSNPPRKARKAASAWPANWAASRSSESSAWSCHGTTSARGLGALCVQPGY